MINEHIASPSAGLKRLNCKRIKTDGIECVYDENGTLLFKNASYYTLLAYCRLLLPINDPINKNGDFNIKFSMKSAIANVSKQLSIKIPDWLNDKMLTESN